MNDSDIPGLAVTNMPRGIPDSSLGTADPFAVALEQTSRRLDAAGWRRDATVPARYAKIDPGTRGPDHRPVARISPPASEGLGD